MPEIFEGDFPKVRVTSPIQRLTELSLETEVTKPARSRIEQVVSWLRERLPLSRERRI
ncbi:hypothetical protein HYS97_02600 [Candidatus Daviesbacteria bacterium]|nr:hypothetical protein [Candidatus Daviesbacteria bacterium]